MPLIPPVIVGSAPVSGLSEAWDINESGTVVGQEDTLFPFVWRPSVPNGMVGASIRLGTLPHPVQPTGTATSINAAGDVVGFCETVDPYGATVNRATLWRGGAGPAISLNTLWPNLLPPGGFLGNSRALAINDTGVIVGESDNPLGRRHAFLFDPVLNAMRDLGSLMPPTLAVTPDSSCALKINNRGHVVGNASAVDSSGKVVTRAFLLYAGSVFMTDLGTLVAGPSGGFLGGSSAIAINTSNSIVGDSDSPAGPGTSTGAFFGAGGPPTGIAPVYMTALDLNDSDVVVGALGNPPSQAFKFSRATGMTDLSGLLAGYQIWRAVAINNRGQIAAIARKGATTSIAVLM